ncbi:MAG TPA: DNA translocase FtsK, partial [Dehalococcoidia bacterium]
MARTGVKPRSPSKPRGVRHASPRSTRPRVGRKRRDETFIDVFIAWFLRVETIGLGLALAALALLLLLLNVATPPSAVADVARATGAAAFGFVAALAGVAYLVWRRDVGLLLEFKRYVLALVPAFVFVSGCLSFFEPSWRLAGAHLTHGAGGDLGDFLTGSIPGVLAWLAAGVAFVAVAWPRSIELSARHGPVVASTVWGWGIPGRIATAIVAVVEFAFPTKPPIDEHPQHIPPSWLPPEREPIERFEVEPPAEEQPPPGPARQVGLPMDWKDEEEREPAPLPASSFGWTLPPMDMLAAGPAADAEIAKPDNTARAALIVETLASFGVDARVVQVNEGPTVTQFGIEPGWDIKYRQTAERDRDGKPVVGKDGKPQMRQDEVSRTRVRVNEITRLQNDLALALAAPAIRIEAPVPGKAVIGIEVPNSAASVVTLRSVIETPAFQRLETKSKLTLALGKSVSGEPVVADLAKM